MLCTTLPPDYKSWFDFYTFLVENDMVPTGGGLKDVFVLQIGDRYFDYSLTYVMQRALADVGEKLQQRQFTTRELELLLHGWPVGNASPMTTSDLDEYTQVAAKLWNVMVEQKKKDILQERLNQRPLINVVHTPHR